MARYRGWCFTLNNWTDIEEGEISIADCQYLVYGKEIGEQGTPHLQGYIYFKNKKSLRQLKELVSQRAHFEAAKGTGEENRTYCTKQGDFYERGECPASPKDKGEMEKERWEGILSEAREKGEVSDPKVQYYTGKIAKWHYEQHRKKQKLEITDRKMLWFYGDTRTGKSTKALELYPDAYLKECNRWWCDYEGEEAVIIEDFDIRDEHLIRYMKLWCDRLPFAAEIKGGRIKIRPKVIIVTSNYHPNEIWTRKQDIEPILERFEVTHFVKNL